MPPEDNQEARQRIIEAGARCAKRSGAAATTLSSVADELGVTRHTVYRYFNNREDLFSAVAMAAFREWGANLADRLAQIDDVVEMLIELIIAVVDRPPADFTLLLDIERADLFGRRLLTGDPFRMTRGFLEHSGFDWAGIGFDDKLLDSLTEFVLRMIQSLMIAPSDPRRTPEELRSFLRMWIGPAVDHVRCGTG